MIHRVEDPVCSRELVLTSEVVDRDEVSDRWPWGKPEMVSASPGTGG